MNPGPIYRGISASSTLNGLLTQNSHLKKLTPDINDEKGSEKPMASTIPGTICCHHRLPSIRLHILKGIVNSNLKKNSYLILMMRQGTEKPMASTIPGPICCHPFAFKSLKGLLTPIWKKNSYLILMMRQGTEKPMAATIPGPICRLPSLKGLVAQNSNLKKLTPYINGEERPREADGVNDAWSNMFASFIFHHLGGNIIKNAYFLGTFYLSFRIWYISI